MKTKLTPSEQAHVLKIYSKKLKKLLPLATKAYGARNIDSPQHEASREYTERLIEYYTLGGSLMQMSEALGVTYASLRRRIMTDEVQTPTRRERVYFSEAEYVRAAGEILLAKEAARGRTRDGKPSVYHLKLKEYYDEGYSLGHLAKLMGLSSANPLYWGVSRATIAEQETLASKSKQVA